MGWLLGAGGDVARGLGVTHVHCWESLRPHHTRFRRAWHCFWLLFLLFWAAGVGATLALSGGLQCWHNTSHPTHNHLPTHHPSPPPHHPPPVPGCSCMFLHHHPPIHDSPTPGSEAGHGSHLSTAGKVYAAGRSVAPTTLLGVALRPPTPASWEGLGQAGGSNVGVMSHNIINPPGSNAGDTSSTDDLRILKYKCSGGGQATS